MDKCWIFVKLLTLLLVVKNCNGIYMFDAKLEKMIELNARKPHCRVHTDRGHVSRKITETCFLYLTQRVMCVLVDPEYHFEH